MEQQLVPFTSRKSGLVRLENQTFARRGYKTDGLLEYLSNPIYGQIGDWTELESVVRLFEQRNSETNRQHMRRRLTQAYHVFLERGYLLLRNYNGAGQIVAVKLFDPQSPEDRAFAETQIDGMQEQCTTRDRRLDKAAEIAGIKLQWSDPDNPIDESEC